MVDVVRALPLTNSPEVVAVFRVMPDCAVAARLNPSLALIVTPTVSPSFAPI
jgi:hypothetical protein